MKTKKEKKQHEFKKQFLEFLMKTVRPIIQKLIAEIVSNKHQVEIMDFSYYFDESYKISIKNTRKYFKMVVSGNHVEQMIYILTEYDTETEKNERITKHKLSEIDSGLIGDIFMDGFRKISQ